MWFADELGDILSAIESANGDVADLLEGPVADSYRQGFRAAISAIRQAVGVRPQQRRYRTLSQARLPDYRR